MSELFVCLLCGSGKGEQIGEDALGSSWLLHYISDRARRPYPSGVELIIAHHHRLHRVFILSQAVNDYPMDRVLARWNKTICQ